MLKVVTKLFGTKSDRDIKEVLPIVEKINQEYGGLSSLSDDQLREKSAELDQHIQTQLKEYDDQVTELRQQVASDPEMTLEAKEAAFDQVDSLSDQKDEALEKVLNDILPQAFAIVKETARRFKEGGMRVTATLLDKQLAAKHDFVEIEGETAIWHKSWIAAGGEITWEMVHYDVQMIGGIVLHSGKIAEMATGEGKTLVATLPAFLNGLSHQGVHVVTVNNYLAKRDMEWMRPLFTFHGLTIDCVDLHRPNSMERREAYKCDIVYGTNNEFGFDYLRDNMARDPRELVQGKHHFTMVDEVDSVLIDEARTPLIISGPVPKGDQSEELNGLKPRISKLVEAQRKLTTSFLTEAKKKIKEGDEKEGGLALFRAHRGMPKYKPLIKYLSEPGMKQLLQKTENIYLAENQKLMPEADEPLFFTIDEKIRDVQLSEKGIETLTGNADDPDFFILPDMAMEVGAIDNDESLSDSDRAQKKDQLIQEYTIKSQRIHLVNQLLKAYTMYERDQEYILQDGKVKIVDEQTGRVMDGRRWSDGLHQAVEAKENVKVEDATQTYATITLQNYFRMYHKISGMTGTAETEAGEFWDIYKLDVVAIPTNKPIARNDEEDKVYKTVKDKFNAVVEEIVELTKVGRPVLVGTTSVEISEVLSRMLNLRKIEHNILNAKQHAREAEIVAVAGQTSRVTIATNMAGRGTDIKLSPESKAAGGLAIIGTERHESRRVDRQLRGRAGRQGDPGSSQFFVSLEDNLMRLFSSDRVSKWMDRIGFKEGEVIQHKQITKSIERAQKKVEENNFGIRKRLLEYDDVMNSQREVIYKRRRNALFGERLDVDIMTMFSEITDELVNTTYGNFEAFKLTALGTLGLDYQITEEEFGKISQQELSDNLYSTLWKTYQEKIKAISKQFGPVFAHLHRERGATLEMAPVMFTDGKKQMILPVHLAQAVETEAKTAWKSVEKSSVLNMIDEGWRDHLRGMDDLKQQVRNASFEQKDPLLIYKFEGFEAFKKFLGEVNESTSGFLMRGAFNILDPDKLGQAQQQQRRQQPKVSEEKEESRSVLNPPSAGPGGPGAPRPRGPIEKPKPVKSEKTYGRNDRVTVQYNDGSVKKDVKYKTVEEDLKNNACVVIED
ncbi:MAG: preprotein translocase subunit SecA [Bacteroidota bacterium]